MVERRIKKSLTRDASALLRAYPPELAVALIGMSDDRSRTTIVPLAKSPRRRERWFSSMLSMPTP